MKKVLLSSLLLAGTFTVLSHLYAADVEVGTVKWGRDLDASLKASEKSGKPVLVLFQEVPG